MTKNKNVDEFAVISTNDKSILIRYRRDGNKRFTRRTNTHTISTASADIPQMTKNNIMSTTLGPVKEVHWMLHNFWPKTNENVQNVTNVFNSI